MTGSKPESEMNTRKYKRNTKETHLNSGVKPEISQTGGTKMA